MKSKYSVFWPKTMDYSSWFDFESPKKVLRKVSHSKVHEKRSLMALVSVAYHLRVESYMYERLEFFIVCTF